MANVPTSPTTPPQAVPPQAPAAAATPRRQARDVKRTKGVLQAQAAARNQARQAFNQGLATVLDLISPASLVVTPNYLKLNNKFVKTLFVYTYPRYIQTNWLSDVINYDVECDISLFIYPQDSQQVMSNLRRRTTQLQSTQNVEQERGLIRDPELETAIARRVAAG
jgi:conjugal transfer ATP-binding protein TraC